MLLASRNIKTLDDDEPVVDMSLSAESSSDFGSNSGPSAATKHSGGSLGSSATQASILSRMVKVKAKGGAAATVGQKRGHAAVSSSSADTGSSADATSPHSTAPRAHSTTKAVSRIDSAKKEAPKSAPTESTPAATSNALGLLGSYGSDDDDD